MYSHRIHWLALCWLVSTLGFALPSSAAPRAGVAAAVRGDVKLAREGAVGRAVETGAPIFIGDEIQTGADSGLQILLLDETVFTLGPNSKMLIDNFVFDPESSEGELNAELVRGAFRFISGRIAKNDPDKMKVKLPSGTIGIRGTMVDTQVDPALGRALVMLAGPGVGNPAGLKAGHIRVGNAGVQQDVLRSGWGVEIPDATSPPTPPFPVPPEMFANFQFETQNAPNNARPADKPKSRAKKNDRSSPNRDDGAKPKPRSGNSRREADSDERKDSDRRQPGPRRNGPDSGPGNGDGDGSKPPLFDGEREGPLGEPLEGEPLEGEPLGGEPLEGEPLPGEPMEGGDPLQLESDAFIESDAGGQLLLGTDGAELDQQFGDTLQQFDSLNEDPAQLTTTEMQTSMQTSSTAMFSVTRVTDLLGLSSMFDGHFIFNIPDIPFQVGGGNLDLIVDLDFNADVVGIQVLDVQSSLLMTSGSGAGATSVPFGSGLSGNAAYNAMFDYVDMTSPCSVSGPCTANVWLDFVNVDTNVARRLKASVGVREFMGTNQEQTVPVEVPITQVLPPAPQ